MNKEECVISEEEVVIEYPRLVNLACYKTVYEKKKYKSKILNKTFNFGRWKVLEYVDYKSGEIISAQTAKYLGVKEYNYEPLSSERIEILDSFRKEVKDFARFVLHFRNQRGGVSPSVQHVVEYYSKYTDKRKDNIERRLLPKLKNMVIASNTLLMPPFQIHGGTRADHLMEDTEAENTFLTLMIRKRFSLEIEKSE